MEGLEGSMLESDAILSEPWVETRPNAISETSAIAMQSAARIDRRCLMASDAVRVDIILAYLSTSDGPCNEFREIL